VDEEEDRRPVLLRVDEIDEAERGRPSLSHPPATEYSIDGLFWLMVEAVDVAESRESDRDMATEV